MLRRNTAISCLKMVNEISTYYIYYSTIIQKDLFIVYYSHLSFNKVLIIEEFSVKKKRKNKRKTNHYFRHDEIISCTKRTDRW